MSLIEQQTPLTRLVTAGSALCDFLDEPLCRQCEVLEICLKRLCEDAAERRSVYPVSLLRALRRVVPFPYAHRRCDRRRCVPAEIFAAYLTPGEEPVPNGAGNPPALAWMGGEQDIHW